MGPLKSRRRCLSRYILSNIAELKVSLHHRYSLCWRKETVSCSRLRPRCCPTRELSLTAGSLRCFTGSSQRSIQTPYHATTSWRFKMRREANGKESQSTAVTGIYAQISTNISKTRDSRCDMITMPSSRTRYGLGVRCIT